MAREFVHDWLGSSFHVVKFKYLFTILVDRLCTSIPVRSLRDIVISWQLVGVIDAVFDACLPQGLGADEVTLLHPVCKVI